MLAMENESKYIKGETENAYGFLQMSGRTARQSVGTEAPKELIVLTNSAIQLYVRMEPRDQLEKLLASSGGVSEADLRHLFSQYGAKEVCAMCLAIITEKDMNANVSRFPFSETTTLTLVVACSIKLSTHCIVRRLIEVITSPAIDRCVFRTISYALAVFFSSRFISINVTGDSQCDKSFLFDGR